MASSWFSRGPARCCWTRCPWRWCALGRGCPTSVDPRGPDSHSPYPENRHPGEPALRGLGDSGTRGLGSSPAPPSTSCFTVSCSLIGAAGDRRHPVALLCKRPSCLRGVAVLAWTAPTPPCLPNLPCVPAGRSASAPPSLSLVRSHSALHRAPRPHPRGVRGLFLSGSLRGGPRLPTLCLLSSWLSPHQSRLKAPVGVRRPHPCRG